MQKLLYYFMYAIVWSLSLMPWRIMYALSTLLYFILFKIFGYRQKIIDKNLKNSFPEKSDTEIQNIRRNFGRYFCDLILETFKTISIGPKMLKKRVTFSNMSLLEKYSSQDKSVILVLGHHGNWELIGAAFAPYPYHKLFVIYHPLKNKIFDRLFYQMRTRLGNGLIPMKNTFRGMLANRNKQTATAFISDQTPSNPQKAYWTTFLNQDTPVFRGVEAISRKLNYPIIFVSVRRPGRGYYHLDFQLISNSPADVPIDEISETHTRMLETDIRSQPEIWLWSHQRWKHKRPASI